MPARAFQLDLSDTQRLVLRRDIVAQSVRSIAISLLLAIAVQICLDLGGSDSMVAWLNSAVHVGLLGSLAYVQLSRRFLSRLTGRYFWPQAISALVMVSVGFAWLGSREALTFAALVGLAHALIALSTPLLGTIYGAVYPADRRGRIVSYGRMATGFVALGATYAIGVLLERDLAHYRWLYPALGAAFVASVWWFCRIEPHGSANHGRGYGMAGLWTALRDKEYRNFQFYQFLLGLANLGVSPVIAIYVKKELKLPMDLRVLVVANGVILQTMVLVTIRLQGAMYDRLGVMTNRVATSVMMGVGAAAWAFADSLELAIVAAVLHGLGQAGGRLIWTLGPLSFAPPGQEDIYNGLHTFLTGVRGVIAPLLFVQFINPESPTFLGYRTTFLAASAVILFSAFGHWASAPKTRPREG